MSKFSRLETQWYSLIHVVIKYNVCLRFHCILE